MSKKGCRAVLLLLWLAVSCCAGLVPFDLNDVRLLPFDDESGTPSFAFSTEKLNAAYLRFLDPDRLLLGYRAMAGLSPKLLAATHRRRLYLARCERGSRY